MNFGHDCCFLDKFSWEDNVIMLVFKNTWYDNAIQWTNIFPVSVVKVLESLCFHWTAKQKSMKKKKSLSQYRIHIRSSTLFSLWRVCTQQCFWLGGQPLLGRVGSWSMWDGHRCGWGLWLGGQQQLCTSGLWSHLLCFQTGNSKPCLSTTAN